MGDYKRKQRIDIRMLREQDFTDIAARAVL